MFFAEISESQAQEKISVLQNAVLRKAQIEVKETGFFPSSAKPRVFWAGIESPELIALQKKTAELTGCVEERAFNPHVTLARIKSGKSVSALQKLQKKHANEKFGVFVAEKLFFKKSELKSEGAIHSILAEIALS